MYFEFIVYISCDNFVTIFMILIFFSAGQTMLMQSLSASMDLTTMYNNLQDLIENKNADCTIRDKQGQSLVRQLVGRSISQLVGRSHGWLIAQLVGWSNRSTEFGGLLISFLILLCITLRIFWLAYHVF